MQSHKNIDPATVSGFGDEWRTFDQSTLTHEELDAIFQEYFAGFPWEEVASDAEGADIGCGSGRWARRVAPRVGTLHCADASEAALAVARRNLADQPNVRFHQASVDALPFEDGSLDFAYTLGVLHHIPDTEAGLRSCARVIKPGGHFLVYLYYALDGRPTWFKALWRATDLVRKGISARSHMTKMAITSVIAAAIYLPLARLAALVERLGGSVRVMPLAYYRHRSFYTMRTDAYDRFGTRLERRFTKEQVGSMLRAAGFERITFNEDPPYWCANAVRSGDG